MRRIYHHYKVWEDWKAGLYDIKRDYSEKETEELANKVKNLLSNSDKFYRVGINVIKEWHHSADMNLSNTSRNRQAWIGQASCCYVYGIPERITKMGWRLLSLDEQKQANLIADKIIDIWEKRLHDAQKLLK